MSGRDERSALPGTAAEWTSFLVSLALLGVVVGAIALAWAREPSGPPRFEIERGTARFDGGRYHLPFAVTNVGGATAVEVRVEGLVVSGGREERVGTLFRFLPIRGRAEGTLVFSADPAAAAVEVVSYHQSF